MPIAESPVTPPRSRFLDIDGPVHYQEWPGAPGAAFVCLHSVGGSHLHWQATAPGLVRHGRVLALDLVGFGLTPCAGRNAGVQGNQRLLSRFLRAAGASPAVLVGHSMGGGLALLQAAREPQSVRALILSSCVLPVARAGASDRAAFGWYVARRLGMRARALGRAVARPPTLERIVSDTLRGSAADPDSIDPELIRASVELVRRTQVPGETARAYAEAARSTFRLLSRPAGFRRQLDRVVCPVLLIHGGRDRTVPLAFAQRAAADHALWRLEILPELGHLPQLEDPERWIATVERSLHLLLLTPLPPRRA